MQGAVEGRILLDGWRGEKEGGRERAPGDTQVILNHFVFPSLDEVGSGLSALELVTLICNILSVRSLSF